MNEPLRNPRAPICTLLARQLLGEVEPRSDVRDEAEADFLGPVRSWNMYEIA